MGLCSFMFVADELSMIIATLRFPVLPVKLSHPRSRRTTRWLMMCPFERL